MSVLESGERRKKTEKNSLVFVEQLARKGLCEAKEKANDAIKTRSQEDVEELERRIESTNQSHAPELTEVQFAVDGDPSRIEKKDQ